MTKTQKKKEIKKLIEHYQEVLYLQGWDITYELSNEWSLDGAAANAHLNYIYKHCKVVIHDCAFHKDNDIEHIVKHELIHCLTEPLYLYCIDLLNGVLRTHNDINDQRELLTEQIAKLIK